MVVGGARVMMCVFLFFLARARAGPVSSSTPSLARTHTLRRPLHSAADFYSPAMAAAVAPVDNPLWPVELVGLDASEHETTATVRVTRGIGSLQVSKPALEGRMSLRIVIPGLRGCEGLTLDGADLRHRDGVNIQISPASDDNEASVVITLSRAVIDSFPPSGTLRVVDFFR